MVESLRRLPKHLRLSIATLTVYSASCRRIENLPMWSALGPIIGWCLVLGHGCGWPSLPSCWADRSLRLMERTVAYWQDMLPVPTGGGYAYFRIPIRNADAVRFN